MAAAREEFAILDTRVEGHHRIFLDNAATTQKPRAVVARIAHFYAHENFHAKSAEAYASAREVVARFIGAAARELAFLRGATDAIALVADTWGRENILSGDEIVISALEHQANFLPWRRLAGVSGATLRVVPVEPDGDLTIDAVREHVNLRTRLVAITHVSNVLGTVTPIRAIASVAHEFGARVLVDGAQAVAHLPVDVKELGVDFYAFSAHKVFGPTGVGALFVGNGMDCTNLEAGTPDVAGAAGLAAAMEMLSGVSLAKIGRHERLLLDQLCDGLQRIPRLRLIGTAKNKIAIQSFVIDGMAPEAIKVALEAQHVEVQAGVFSAQPVLAQFGFDTAVRVSLAFYNNARDVDIFLDALKSIAS
jgi:cysteine desulfurase/selenocysteine lyase